MATLLSELVRVLSSAAARELRGRADQGPALSRAEFMALATLNDLSAACCAAGKPAPGLQDTTDLALLAELAAFDMAIIDSAKMASKR